MRSLERQGRLNREVEFLPDDEAIRQRGAASHPDLAAAGRVLRVRWGCCNGSGNGRIGLPEP